MTRTATGYGLEYEHKISKACAQTLRGDLDLPKMGYETQVAIFTTPSSEPAFAVSERLYIQNISGSFYLACTSSPKISWPRLFKILLSDNRAVRIAVPEQGRERAEGWATFPMERPLNVPVLVVIDGKIVEGNGGSCPQTGGTIIADGRKYDSNHTLSWRYVYESAQQC